METKDVAQIRYGQYISTMWHILCQNNANILNCVQDDVNIVPLHVINVGQFPSTMVIC